MGTVEQTGVEDGILNVCKEPGWTSHDVVAHLRGMLGKRRVGHAGTLDPAATGVLPVLIGKGTRIAEFLVEWDKEYRAVLRLGEKTDTQDATGTVGEKRSTQAVTQADIRKAVSRFQGPIQQIPPMYSAVKVKGVPLHKAARAGRTVERQPREVTIRELEVLGITGDDVSLRVVCSKGTYIRTLCEDIGEYLEVGGHLLSLERTRVGPLTIREALSLQVVREKVETSRLSEVMLSLDQALETFPAVVVTEEQAQRTIHGVAVPYHPRSIIGGDSLDTVCSGDVVRVKSPDGRLLALASTAPKQQDGQPERMVDSTVTLPILKVFVDS